MHCSEHTISYLSTKWHGNKATVGIKKNFKNIKQWCSAAKTMTLTTMTATAMNREDGYAKKASNKFKLICGMRIVLAM